MKKFYLLLSAACVAVSASAVEKEMMTGNAVVKGEATVAVAAPAKDARVARYLVEPSAQKKASKTRATGNYAYFRAADNVMSIGMSQEGTFYKGIGFASSYGDLLFNNYSTGAKAYEWKYAEVGDFQQSNNGLIWNYKTSNAQDLSVKSAIGEMIAPELTVQFESGAKEIVKTNAQSYICGASPNFWGLESMGVSFYQNTGLEDPTGHQGGSSYKTSYNVTAKEYNANGVYVDKSNPNNWEAVVMKQCDGKAVSNLALDNFTIIQPEPASGYFITQAWCWVNVNATAATQLVSYIYPIDDEGYISDTPIALGYAPIPKGQSKNVVFSYNPLNEDGDEIEGAVIIDSAVAFTIEGFAGNKVIKEVTPVSGYYPFSYESYAGGNYDICREPYMYLHFTFDVEGQSNDMYLYDRGLYYFNNNQVNGKPEDVDTLTMLTYAQLTTDATFAFIHASEETVNLPKEGGKAELEVEALYYNVNANLEEGIYKIIKPDWVKVEFGESSQETGVTPMTISVEASEEGRTGVVSLAGLGVSCDITVNQGEGGAVNVVVADKDAKYYDLSGRRVVNPEKGLYIKVSGDKAEKVVL